MEPTCDFCHRPALVWTLKRQGGATSKLALCYTHEAQLVKLRDRDRQYRTGRIVEQSS